MMSIEKNKALARRYQEEVWGKGNLALIDELLAADFVDHSLPAGMDPTFAGAKRAVKGALDAFPEGQWTVEDLIAEGDKVVIRWKMKATHEHEFRGIAPGGKPVTITGITILRMPGGKIAERWVNWDSLALRQPSETLNLGAV
jgi:predicted ester cyclase